MFHVERLTLAALLFAALPTLAQAQSDPCAALTTTSDTITTGRARDILFQQSKTVPTSPTDPTPVPVRIDGYFVKIDALPEQQYPKPATSLTCANGNWGFILSGAVPAVSKGSHQLVLTPWNFVYNPDGTPTTTVQRGPSATRPFVAVDPFMTGPPPAPTGVRIF